MNRVILGCAAVAVNRVKGMEGEAPPLHYGGRGAEWSSSVEGDLHSCGLRCAPVVRGVEWSLLVEGDRLTAAALAVIGLVNGVN
ncbi:hypothetical protein DEO72_LG11g1501 [Vigna unguiculata]|uniref:Uncharacterized protein n=1 Tax=Vigna unguiculata TaxID=3917 RepID=A0A4D6NL40_VIGUN|nr:hypothetical protein DEO72_LG11g1501 [Vigna unguiculata]